MTAPQDRAGKRSPERVIRFPAIPDTDLRLEGKNPQRSGTSGSGITSSLWDYRTGEWIWMGLAAAGVVALVLWAR